MKRRTLCVAVAMLMCLAALAGCSGGGDGLVGNVYTYDHDSIDNYDAGMIDSYYTSSFEGYNGMRSFEKTTVGGVDAIVCSYGVGMNGVEMVGTQYYLFGKDFTDVITFTSVSGDYDDDFEDIAQSITVH